MILELIILPILFIFVLIVISIVLIVSIGCVLGIIVRTAYDAIKGD